jgi:KaiC/GvpD/RAD55 family RecA-like ATPase
MLKCKLNNKVMKMVFCSRCGAKNDEDTSKCKSCGAPIHNFGGERDSRHRRNELARLSWNLRTTLARVRPDKVGWMNRIFTDNITDDEKRAEAFRYAIERIEYSAANPTVSTGIDELDDILYGGVPQGYTLLLTSPPLDETNLLTESFLTEGIDRGEVILLLSTRLRGIASDLAMEKPESFYLVLCSPRSDLIMGDAPNIIKFRGVENLTQLNIILETLLRNISERGRSLKRVVMNIVSDAILANEINVARRWLFDLLTMFKYVNATTLSTLDPGMHSKGETRTVIDLFDGHLDIEEKDVDGERRKTLTVRRLYGKKFIERELLLERKKLTKKV